MTVALLMENTYQAALRQWESDRSRKVRPLKLNMLEKVPTDIEIAMAQTPKPIVQLAEEIGVVPDELENYGKYKAKVSLSVLDRLAHRTNGKYIVVAGYVASRVRCDLLLIPSQYHPDTLRRGQIYHYHWSCPSSRC
jgi:methylenetetrahydrofolate dehydrogenase (NADP+) / methenyltetrahydrofolate cyclohydrolase / formyltetrahydrofolate synthetase